MRNGLRLRIPVQNFVLVLRGKPCTNHAILLEIKDKVRLLEGGTKALEDLTLNIRKVCGQIPHGISTPDRDSHR